VHNVAEASVSKQTACNQETNNFRLCHECITSSSMLPRCWKLRNAYEAYSASAIICGCLLLCTAAIVCQPSRLSGTRSLDCSSYNWRGCLAAAMLWLKADTRQVLTAAIRVLAADIHAETAATARQPHHCGVRPSITCLGDYGSDLCYRGASSRPALRQGVLQEGDASILMLAGIAPQDAVDPMP
jgi:hypothetical protein